MKIKLQYKFIVAHMKSAYVYAELSYCKRRQVGCVIVKNNNIIAIGYNGTSSGEINCCEDENNKTLPHVIHAEDNALKKLLTSSNTSLGSQLFVTISPCITCARRIVDAGIKDVFYHHEYNNNAGEKYLLSHGVNVLRVDMDSKLSFLKLFYSMSVMILKKYLLMINKKTKDLGRKIW